VTRLIHSQDCPIARHSPLPELQALVKLFRPKSLSPNTMLNEARGLDYFLLPSLFSDCLASSGSDTPICERDEWFNVNPKFGPGYIKRLKKLQEAGVELVPDFGMDSGRDEYLPESLDLAVDTKLGAGRKANSADRLARAGGLPRMPMADLAGMIHLPAIEQQISAMLEASGGPCALIPGTQSGPQYGQLGRPRRGDDNYDTDEEEDVQRKRRRRLPIAVKGERDSTESKPSSQAITVEMKEERPAATPHHAAIEAKLNLVQVKMEDVKPVIDRAIRKRPRFSIDKEHLRMLSGVSPDVDDL